MTRRPCPSAALVNPRSRSSSPPRARFPAKTRVQLVIILDRVEAAGEARIMKRVDVNRIEPHRGDARQMRGPVRDRPGEGRKQIVDAQPFRHRPVPFAVAPNGIARWHNLQRHNAGSVAAAHGSTGGEDLPDVTAADPGRPGGPVRDRRHSTPQPAICDPIVSDCSPMRLPGINIGAAAYIPPRGIWYGSGKEFDSALSPRDPGPRRRR